MSRSVSNVNSILIFDNSSLLSDVISLIPDIPDKESSIISVTSLSKILEEAPKYTVVTVTTGLSISGYSRMVSLSYDAKPMRITNKLRTAASTGLFTVVSDICITYQLI